MPVQTQTRECSADLTVLVPRDTDDTLEEAVECVVADVDAVAAVEDLQVTDLRPRLNDLAVDVEADLAVSVGDDPPEDSVRERLAEGFGVTVESLQ